MSDSRRRGPWDQALLSAFPTQLTSLQEAHVEIHGDLFRTFATLQLERVHLGLSLEWDEDWL